MTHVHAINTIHETQRLVCTSTAVHLQSSCFVSSHEQQVALPSLHFLLPWGTAESSAISKWHFALHTQTTQTVMVCEEDALSRSDSSLACWLGSFFEYQRLSAADVGPRAVAFIKQLIPALLLTKRHFNYGRQCDCHSGIDSALLSCLVRLTLVCAGQHTA